MVQPYQNYKISLFKLKNVFSIKGNFMLHKCVGHIFIQIHNKMNW